MDLSTYSQLSGKTLSAANAARFEAVVEVAAARLESMLGWPLDPGDWDNQYIEIGKSLDECSCPSADTNDLEDPDEVVGSYRIYNYKPSDVYIAIDPATAIHAVKLVRDNVTYRELDTADYRIQWQNGPTPFTRYLMARNQCACFCDCRHWTEDYTYQVAVDADWAFDELPSGINLIQAELISESFDDKANIKSESVTSHSYTKFDKVSVAELYASFLAQYAGPNGSAKRRVN